MNKLDKLTLDDIKIKSPGKQAKAHILQKYSSVRKFGKHIDMTPKTIYQYLKRTDLGSVKFKVRFREAFDNADFRELILTQEKQIERFVNIIFDDIPQYATPEDFEVIKEVKKLCFEEGLTLLKIKMDRNRAMYYLKNNRVKQCIEMLEYHIERAYRLKFYNHWIYFSCDLARAYNYIGDYTNTKKVLSGLHIDRIKESRDDDFKDRALFKYYYGYGILSNRIGLHDDAEAFYEKSLEHAKTNTHKGVSIMNIGLTYKKKGNFSKALEYYFNALEIQPSKEECVALYNNIAEIYKQKGMYDTALEYIEKAKEMIITYSIHREYVTYVTYLEIKFLKDGTESALTELMEWTKENNKKRVQKSFIIIGLNIIIDLAIKSKSYASLHMIEDLIMDIIYKSKEKIYIKELQACFGKVGMFFYEENFGGRN